MRFFIEEGALIARNRHETLRIEAWGTDALRLRATLNPAFDEGSGVLEKPKEPVLAHIQIEDGFASIENGKIKASVNPSGVLSVYRDGVRVLHEYHRNYDQTVTKQSVTLKYEPREFKGIAGGDWRLKWRLESNPRERFYGMGQYQEPVMNLKGSFLELNQRNSQVSVPFVLSDQGYGLFWNMAGTGRATFGNNLTEWSADATKGLDVWICAGSDPKAIVETFTEMTGRPPHMPSDLLGLWQCKLRYRTQKEVLDVARQYHERGIPLDVIVIDFFHWTRQGDWQFDPVYWPDPKAMCDELHSYGIKVMVSIWPSVDKKSVHYVEMEELGLLMQTESGANQTYDYQGDCVEVDVFNPAAREYIWNVCKKNYYDLGIDLFWLDNIEPDLAVYDYENYRYYGGPHLECGNLYPQLMAKAFYDGLKAEGEEDVCLLTRCGWAGNQKYGTVIWSGDVQSNFETLRTQVMQGLNMGVAGISWWTTDIGGFMTDDYHDPAFVELLERWFAWAVFTPILRLHGTRGPLDIEPLSELDYGGGYLYTGHDNEIWSYGEEAQRVLKKFLEMRLALKPYIEGLYDEAQRTGLPLMRAMFLEYPDDTACWDLDDQYMFGDRLLVAPILEAKATSRLVYLPAGTWKRFGTGEIVEGGRTITMACAIDEAPVYEKVGGKENGKWQR